MRCIFSVLALCLCGTVAVAQTPRITVEPGDGLPETTIVPVLEPAVHLTEHTFVDQVPKKGMTHAQRRALPALRFTQGLDSLLQSRDYMFVASSMQAEPRGAVADVAGEFFYFGVFVDHAEAHLPEMKRAMLSPETFDLHTAAIEGYRMVFMPWGWEVAFRVVQGDVSYNVSLATSAHTGETTLALQLPAGVVRYDGWLWDGGHHRRRRQ